MQVVCSECHMPNPPDSETCSSCARPLAGEPLAAGLDADGALAAEAATPPAQPQLPWRRDNVKRWLISGAVFLGICLVGLVTTFLLRRSVFAGPIGAAHVTVTQSIALQGPDATPEPAPTTRPADRLEPGALSAPGEAGECEGSLTGAGQEPGTNSAELETASTRTSQQPEAASEEGPDDSLEPEVALGTTSQQPEVASEEEPASDAELEAVPAEASQEPEAASEGEPASGPEAATAPLTSGLQAEVASSELEPVPPVPAASPTPQPTDAPEPTQTPKPALPPAKKPVVRPAGAPIGARVRAGTWLLTVTGVQWHQTLRWQEWSREAEGVWAVLLLDIENQGESTIPFRMLRPELHGGQGAVYDESATYYAAWQFSGRETAYTDLAPGQRAHIVMAFDVPEEVKGLMLYADRLAQGIVQIGDAPLPTGP